MLTSDIERLRKILSYDPETGVFRWTSGERAGTVASSLNATTGYVRIRALGKQFLAHRLAWAFVNGAKPSGCLDHINCDKTDNRIENLREATVSQNMHNRGIQRNNSTGFKGVYFHKRAQKYTAQIKVSGKKIYLGTFDTALDAHTAYCFAAKALHGEFARAA